MTPYAEGNFIANQSITENVEFTIPEGEKFIVIVIPKYAREDTSFGFEYWTEGESYPWYYAAYFSLFANQKYGDEL